MVNVKALREKKQGEVISNTNYGCFIKVSCAIVYLFKIVWVSA